MALDLKIDWLEFLKPLAALAIVAAAVALSLVQRLRLEGDMLFSTARAFVQLIAIGFILEFVFKQHSIAWIFLIYSFMVIIAGSTAGKRSQLSPYIAGASIAAGTLVTIGMLLAFNIFPLTPRYMIPVCGMMVGSSMTVTGVGMKRLRDEIRSQMDQVETALALGATPYQAVQASVGRALNIALSPILDSTKTLGLIAMPGAMTGLIMAGSSPLEAIRLQLIVTCMQMGACTFSGMASTYLSWSSFFTKTCQVDYKIFVDE